MDFLHSEFQGGPGDVALVTLNRQANVMLLSTSDFHSYREGRQFEYYGGWATQSPVRLSPPYEGRWHVVVDLGNYSGTVRASVQIVRGPGISARVGGR